MSSKVRHLTSDRRRNAPRCEEKGKRIRTCGGSIVEKLEEINILNFLCKIEGKFTK